MRVAFLTANAKAGDAIGNLVAEKVAFFLDRGADVRVFLESRDRLHPFVRKHCRVVQSTEPDADAWTFLSNTDLVIVEYGHFYRLLHWLPLLVSAAVREVTPHLAPPPQGGTEVGDASPRARREGNRARILLDYHGVTPTDLWETHNREAIEKGARQRGLVWCADAAIAHSHFTRNELIEATGYPRENAFQLAHPVDLGRFSPDVDKQDIRKRLGLEAARILLFVGRLASNKRVPFIVEALSRLTDLQPPVHAVVVGDVEDIYELEAERCRERARELRVADRLHFLGHVAEDALVDAYRSADVFVMPSRHEGFCIPVVEAMACGVPVVAARAAALPETAGGAALLFNPDDPAELAKQVRRVLVDIPAQGEPPHPDPSPQGGLEMKAPAPQGGRETVFTHAAIGERAGGLRVAVVALHDGTRHIGGAETSLGRMAQALKDGGHNVEVFTIGKRPPERSTPVPEVPVSQFPADPQDLNAYYRAAQTIMERGGAVDTEVEETLLRHSVHSDALVAQLRRRIDDFDAVITGPYLSGVAGDVASQFPAKTLLVPCFHDEPTARLKAWRRVFGDVGGILFHSPEERQFAHAELGLAAPGGGCVGTFIDMDRRGNSDRGAARVGSRRPCIVYCGRYLKEKRLPELLEFARRYDERHQGRFTFVFMGQGPVTIPAAPWARDLGFVGEQEKCDVLSGAAAVAQLSLNESLSLATLEAWAQGVPVLADRRSEVLAGHVRRSGGGVLVDSYESFAAALDDLDASAQQWRDRGSRGRDYVREQYGSREAFSRNLEQFILELNQPLRDRLRRRGLERGAQFSRVRWRKQFGRLVEELLDRAPRTCRLSLDIEPRSRTRRAIIGTDAVLVPIRVGNSGTHPVVGEGPARMSLRARLGKDGTDHIEGPEVPLPTLLLPGQTVSVALPVPVPCYPGTYSVQIHVAEGRGPNGMLQEKARGSGFPATEMELVVSDKDRAGADGVCTPMLEAIETALVELQRLERLPDEYTDVTAGRLASLKRWIKRKLLGNFQRAYVDVLSRQQSEFNRQTLTTLSELRECCATIQNVNVPKDDSGRERGIAESASVVRDLLEQLSQSRQECAALEERVARLERALDTANMMEKA
jgi:glycosyltransferase involved in cell wall biosynthesis